MSKIPKWILFHAEENKGYWCFKERSLLLTHEFYMHLEWMQKHNI
jgi:hypothetical protein